MSYSRSYKARITVSGSVSVNYPASQKSGTITQNYTKHEDVNITINVNTDEFDASVHGCNNNLNVLTGAVVAMDAAQCKEIQDSANKISSTVIGGFFGMISSELSQQMAELKNKYESQFALLSQLSQRILDYRAVMSSDFSRITSRYKDLFDELNKECYRRVYVLDKACFALSESVLKEMIVDSRLKDAAYTLSYTSDINHGHSTISTSRLRNQCAMMIASLKNYILQGDILARDCAAILSPENCAKKQTMYCPVLVRENDTIADDAAISSTNYFVPDNLEENTRKKILEKINNAETEGDINWLEFFDREDPQVKSEFIHLLESSSSDQHSELTQRQNSLIMELWGKSFPQQEASV